MSKLLRFNSEPNPIVTVEACHGDLVVRGWSEQTVLAKGECQAEGGPKALSFQSRGSLTLNVPAGTTLIVTVAYGDVAVAGLTGEARLEMVHGDLAVKNIGQQVTIHTVHGDLAGRDVNGDLTIEQVSGDISLRHIANLTVKNGLSDIVAHFVEGAVAIETANGDVSLRTVNGDVTVGVGLRDVNVGNVSGRVTINDCKGDIRLRGGLIKGDHTLKADGDVVIRWPEDAPLNFVAYTAKVSNRLPLTDVTQKEGLFTGRIGDGLVNLTATANGRVILKSAGEDSPATENDIDVDWNRFGVEMGQLSQRISTELNSRMAELSTRISERTARKAEQAMQRAIEEMERARQKVERQQGRWAPIPPTPPVAPVPPVPPIPPVPPSKAKPQSAKATPEEQMKILGMLEKGIISVVEAETLLKALEN